MNRIQSPTYGKSKEQNRMERNPAAVLAKAGIFPLFGGAEPLSARAAFSALLSSAEAAKEEILLEYYRIRKGEALSRLLPVLTEKALSGVRVCVLADAFGSFLPCRAAFAPLVAAGGKVVFRYRQGGGFFARDHRKLAVIDGKNAYIGGFNLADGYFDPGAIRDVGYRLDGQLARAAQKLFYSRMPEEKPIFSAAPALAAETAEEPGRSSVTQSFFFGGNPKDRLGERVMCALIGSARERVTILSPYLYPTRPMLTALEEAVFRGVIVTLLLPERYDTLPGAAVSRSRYGALLDRGVRIRAYPGAFLHEKLVIADRRAALAGSFNFDYLSMCRNYEDGLLLMDHPALPALVCHAAALIEESEAVI